MKVHPPKWPLRFLRWYCREEHLDEIEGDLIEMFQRQYHHSPQKAKRQFAWSVVRHFRPEFIKSFRPIYHTNSIAMFRNFLKTGWRNLLRYKLYSAINIGGFAVGLSACLLIALYIRHELSYDKHYPDVDRLYRVIGVFKGKDETTRNTYFQPPLAGTLVKDFPEIESAGRLLASDLFGAKGKLRRAESTTTIFEDNLLYADPSMLNMLGVTFTSGNRPQALQEPRTIALSKSKAANYFPGGDALGKTLILNDDETRPYKVAAVFEDFPVTSHIRYEIVLSLTANEFWPGESTDWRSNIYHTYIKVRSGTDENKLKAKLTAGIVKTYLLSSWLKNGIADAQDRANNISLELQPVSDIHLYSNAIHDGLAHGDIRLIWIFTAIAGFILLIACINFINLSTARSANRAKEIGLRKVVGSLRRNLVTQFLTESVLFSFISFILAIALTVLLLPYFNRLFAASLIFPWSEWWLIPAIAVGAVLVGVLAGLYPSIYLSGFIPIQVLKGKLSKGSKSSGMRSALVVFQFSASIILIIGTVVIFRQFSLITTKDVGFNKDQVVLIHGASMIGNELPAFKNELLGLPGIKNVSVSDYLPVTGNRRNGSSFWKKGKTAEDSPVGGQIWSVDHQYITTLGMAITKGRDFSASIASDSQAVIINQAMATAFGWNDPVGKEITDGRSTWQVIGVVKDFHFEPLTENIAPLCLVMGNSESIMAVKVNTGDMSQVITATRSVWNKFSRGETFRYSFLSESFAKMYADIQRTGKIFTGFAFLAISIACLGLFALSSFMLEQRRKEISVRLVLGASASTIYRLLVINFLKLVVIAFLVAAPVAWLIMHQWLQDYVYRVNIGWDVFAMTGIGAVLIALLTISVQTLRAALMSPVTNLRSQ